MGYTALKKCCAVIPVSEPESSNVTEIAGHRLALQDAPAMTSSKTKCDRNDEKNAFCPLPTYVILSRAKNLKNSSRFEKTPKRFCVVGKKIYPTFGKCRSIFAWAQMSARN